MQQAYKLSRLYALTDKNGITDSCFHTRFGANFPIIYDLFEKLYHSHPHKKEAFENLIQILVEKFKERSEEQKLIDIERSKNPNWYASNEIVGMMLYTERFNQNFKGLEEKIPYFKNLGINTLHLMPFLDVPEPDNTVEDKVGKNIEGSCDNLWSNKAKRKIRGVNVVSLLSNHVLSVNIIEQLKVLLIKPASGKRNFFALYTKNLFKTPGIS